MNKKADTSMPFGRRFAQTGGQPIEKDFPIPSRVALFHVLRELEGEGVTVGWYGIICELERLARVAPFDGRTGNQSQEERALDLLRGL